MITFERDYRNIRVLVDGEHAGFIIQPGLVHHHVDVKMILRSLACRLENLSDEDGAFEHDQEKLDLLALKIRRDVRQGKYVDSDSLDKILGQMRGEEMMR